MKEEKMSFLRISIKILNEVIKAAPIWILFDCMAMLVSSIFYAFETIIKQWMFDTMTNVVEGNEKLNVLLGVTVIVVLFMIINEFINAVCNFTWFPAMKTVEGKLKQNIHNKISKLKGNYFEEVDILENIEKAYQGAGQSYGLYNSIATILLFYFPYFIVMGVYLWKLRPLLTLSLLFIFIPHIVNLILRQRIYEKQIDKTAPIKRKRDYYESEVFSREKIKENRLYGSYNFFISKYRDTNDEFCYIKLKDLKKSSVIEILMKCITLIGYMGVIILLITSLFGGYISVGAFAAVFSSITTLIAFMNDAIGNYLGNLFENVGALKRYIQFLELPEENEKDIDLNWDGSIVVNDVSFSYPGTDKKVLDNISFEIRPGETIAFVGENGAGKSTLIKILTGIIYPDNGEVLVDGVNIYETNVKNRFAYTSAVFQKYIRYQMDVRENVQISSEIKDEKLMMESIEKSEFEIDDRFDDGYDTMLSKEFNGIDLSGGQWQRLALARGLYRGHKFIVLDEPTSAIDPIEEGILYRKFQGLVKGKKAVIVTHRLGSVKLADKIIVLKNGRIVQQGKHSDLMEVEGEYSSLYNEQAKWYN